MNKKENKIISQNINNKFCFVGVSLGSTISAESGIAVIDRNLNLIRVDKAFNLNDLQAYIKNLAPIDSVIICVDLPRNANLTSGKWRIEARNTHVFKKNGISNPKFNWAERFSDRGTEFCDSLNELGFDVYRYYCYFTKNILKLNPPYKSRSPVACKYLQTIIQNNLKVSGIPSNLIALSGLDAIIGAYTAWKIASSEENIGYKPIGKFKNQNIVTAI